MKAPPLLETERLILAAPTAADTEAIFQRYAADAEVTRYMAWPRHESIADTQGFLAFSAAEWEHWPAGPYLIRARRDGTLLGGTGLGFEQPDLAMTGYILAKDAWGNGYATEALRAMIDLARVLKVSRIFALCHPEHRASAHVLEKCGFERAHTAQRQIEFPNLVRGKMQDALYYARVP